MMIEPKFYEKISDDKLLKYLKNEEEKNEIKQLIIKRDLYLNLNLNLNKNNIKVPNKKI